MPLIGLSSVASPSGVETSPEEEEDADCRWAPLTGRGQLLAEATAGDTPVLSAAGKFYRNNVEKRRPPGYLRCFFAS